VPVAESHTVSFRLGTRTAVLNCTDAPRISFLTDEERVFGSGQAGEATGKQPLKTLLGDVA